MKCSSVKDCGDQNYKFSSMAILLTGLKTSGEIRTITNIYKTMQMEWEKEKPTLYLQYSSDEVKIWE